MTNQECTNSSIGVKLHAFELGLLDQPERREFEQHLLACDYCFALAQAHADHMKVLSSSRKVHEELIGDLAKGEDGAEKKANIVSGGKKSFLLVWAAAAVLVLAVATTFLLVPSDDNQQASVQTIRFSVLRSATNAEILTSEDGKVRFEFPVESGRQDGVTSVSISAVFENGYNSQDIPWTMVDGYGVAELEKADFKPGLYNFVVEQAVGDTIVRSDTFTFSVREP